MKFGKSTAEAQAEPTRGGGGESGFMKYIKDGDQTLHLLDEPDKWVWYWEHYNPGGYPFPCTNDRDTCPGCTSSHEKMKKASRKIAFNAYDGEYTNVWKVPKTVADKLQNRFERLGTVTDRPYLITRIATKAGDRTNYDFDMEGGDKATLDPDEVQKYWRDPEELLQQAYDDAWGDSPKTSAAKEEKEPEGKAKRGGLAVKRTEPKPEPKQEPEEKIVSEDDLRKMDVAELAKMCEDEGLGEPPANVLTADEIVDWMLTQV